jgi:hypothetical protein
MVAVVVVGLPGTMCCFNFASVVGVIMFRSDLVSGYVPGVGCVVLYFLCLVVLLYVLCLRLGIVWWLVSLVGFV